jgi:hypothetical protein
MVEQADSSSSIKLKPEFQNYESICREYDSRIISRSIRRGRKRPFLIIFDSFSSDRITAVFHRIVNERKRLNTPFSDRLRQLLTVYDTTKNVRTTITTK